MIDPAILKQIFQSFHTGVLRYLGEGGEAVVYELSHECVLKIFKNKQDLHNVQKMHNLTAFIHQQQLPFMTPQILEIREVNNTLVTIERKLSGQTIDQVYPMLPTGQRHIVLKRYLEAVDALAAVLVPEMDYGQYLEESTADNWKTYIAQHAQSKAAVITPILQEDGISYSEVGEKFLEDLHALPEFPPKALVHGDYFFENVMLDDKLEIAAVLDFGWWTCIGDHMMDIAGTLMFLDLYTFVQEEEKRFLNEIITSRYGNFRQYEEIYRIYYSLLLADCKESDPRAYTWSLQNMLHYVSR